MKTEPLLDDLAAALGSEQAAAQVALSLQPFVRTLPDQPQMTLRPPPPQDPSAPGRLRGEAALVFEGELGRGGMGVVHLATQTSVGRKVAVKRQWPASGLEGTVSLLHEAWITGAVEHPHIVPLYDVATDALGQPLVVLKCIDGTSWRALLGDEAAVRRQYGVVDVQAWHLRTLMQVATAVHFAHQRGIVHRDIKPENVMLGGPGEVYLVDWGIARAFDATVDARLPRLDAREGLVGTPAYMAPEMVNPAEEPVGPWTDVYLLGATLHHILSGQAPHQGETALQMVLNVMRGPAAPPGPPELVAICQRAMARWPADRFESADAFRQALQAHLEHRDAGRLAAQAGQRLAELEAGLATLQPHDRQRLFGECRFGFTSALASWPECEAAQQGLRRALILMAEQALVEGQVDAAAGFLAELADPPPELAARVAQAQAAQREQQARLAALEALQREFDPRVGTWARIGLICLVVLVLALRPLGWLLGLGAGAGTPWYWPTAALALVGIGAWLARRHIWTTAINRRVHGMLLWVVVAYVGLSFGVSSLGLSVEERSQHGLHFGAAVLGIFAIAVDLRGLLPACTYLLTYVASILGWLNPHVALLISHSVLAFSVVWIGRRAARGPTLLQVRPPPPTGPDFAGTRRLRSRAGRDELLRTPKAP